MQQEDPDELDPAAAERLRRLLWRRRNALHAKNGIGPRISENSKITYALPSEDPLGDLRRDFAMLAFALLTTIQQANTTPTKEPPAIANKKTKGKGINARMIAVLSENRLAADWSSSEWAQHLDCAEATVRETKAWTGLLKTTRALAAAERAHRV